MKYLILCATVLLLSSCATIVPPPALPSAQYLNSLSSGSIGCGADQIQTYNIQVSGQQQVADTGYGATQTYWINNVYTWQAQCNGKIYYCSSKAPDTGDAHVRTVTCAPAQTQ